MIRGSVHWAAVDKRRPVIIVSADSRNETAHDVLVVPCSTSVRPMGWHVRLGRGEAGLALPSMALCEHIDVVQKEDIEP